MSPLLPLLTERLELRDFEAVDFDAVHSWASDPAVTRFLSWGPNTEDETHAFLALARKHAADSPRQHFELAMALRADAEVVGSCGLLARQPELREFEIGYCLKRSAWGRGLATEAVRRLVAFGFRELQAHRLYARVEPRNPASGRVLEKAGFRLEGHLHQDTLKAGEWRDSLVYALLERELAEAAAAPAAAREPRPARREDAPSLAGLSAELGYPATRREIERRLASILGDPTHAVFVAEREGCVVAWAHVLLARRVESELKAELGGLVVAPAWRRQGVGKALVERCEAWGRARGAREIRVRSREERLDAHRFYESLSYRPVKRQQVLDKTLATGSAGGEG